MSGLWPFISHDSPAEWEWVSGSPDHPWEVDRGVANAIVAARLGDIAEYLGNSSDVKSSNYETIMNSISSGLGSLSPYREGELMKSRFQYQPEWVCVAEVRGSYELPMILHAPSTPNWRGSRLVEALGFGEHAGVLRDWGIRYGAVVYYIGSSSLVLSIDRPPISKIEAARVAVEQFSYCEDLLQIVGDPIAVAKCQVPSTQWFFWWD
ncbi:DUF4253 domain-containing protein [Streptomyces sp. NBC_01190]|uniref:DUF4253 domain-containing protein n=1 Tax=Streptomyces sp. NBC_01190 TaxID=2903767 RepID=UPI0038665B82|nr:DUF4253 domain-containing protein [Streptomyces sp. NBC_01190]